MKDNQSPEENPDHEDGQVGVSLFADHVEGIVRIQFEQSITWIALPTRLARELAHGILIKAEEVEKAQAFVSWGIFFGPYDHPGKWVARRFQGTQPTQEIHVGDSHEQVREAIPGLENLVLVPRQEGDPPFLVETWI